MAGPGKPGPLNKDEAIQRRADMWKLRVEKSLTHQQIADVYGLTQQRVSVILAEAAAEISQATAEEARKAELHKMDIREQECLLIIAQHKDTDNPMVLAAHASLDRIGKRRDNLLGLNAPTQVESRSYEYRVNGVDTEALK